MQAETKGFREPVLHGGKHAKQNARNDHVVEVRDQKQRVVHLKVDGGVGQQNAGHAAEDKGQQEVDVKQHRRGDADSAAVHGQDPVVHLNPGRNADDHRGNTENGIDVGTLAHGEKVMQPHAEREYRDAHGGVDERGVAVDPFADKRRDHLRPHAQGRQQQDVDLRVPEQPEEVGKVHHVSAVTVGEEVETDVAIQREHDCGHGERRHGEDHQNRGAQRGPAEQRHAKHRHARATLFVQGHGKVEPGQG